MDPSTARLQSTIASVVPYTCTYVGFPYRSYSEIWVTRSHSYEGSMEGIVIESVLESFLEDSQDINYDRIYIEVCSTSGK